MSRFMLCLTALFSMPIVSQVAISQRTVATNPDELKHVLVPMPKGIVRAEARDIDKEWTPPIVHLKGNAYVRIYTAAKAPREP